MSEQESRRYLILIELANYSVDRLQYMIPRLQGSLDRMSDKDNELAYRSPKGDVFAYLLRTKLKAVQIRSRLVNPRDRSSFTHREQTDDDIPILGSDKVLIVEVGLDFDAKNFNNKVEPWLAHH